MRLSSSSEAIATASTSRSVKSAKFFTADALFTEFRIRIILIFARQAEVNPGWVRLCPLVIKIRGTRLCYVRSSSCCAREDAMDTIKFRLNDARLAPRRTKLEI